MAASLANAPLIIAVGGRHPRPDAQNWCKRDRTAGYRRTVANSPRQRITAARGLRFTNTLCSFLRPAQHPGLLPTAAARETAHASRCVPPPPLAARRFACACHAPLIIAVGGRHPRPDAQNWCKRDRTAGYRRTVANSPRQRITAARGLRFTNTNTLCSRLCAIHLTGMPEAPDEPSLDFFPRSMYQCTANLIAPNTCQALNVTHRALCSCVCFVSSFHQVQSCYQNYAHNSTLLHSLSLALASCVLLFSHALALLALGLGTSYA